MQPVFAMDEVQEPWTNDDLKAIKILADKLRPPTVQPKRVFDFTINAQSLSLWLIGGLLGVVIYGATFYSTFTGIQASVTNLQIDVKNLQDRLNTMGTAMVQIRDQIAKAEANTATTDLEQQKSLAAIDKSLAVLQERLQDVGKPSGPHGEIATPERFGMLAPSVAEKVLTPGR